MLGGSVPFDTVPFFWTMQFGKSVRYCGHALGFDDIVIEGDLATHTFIAYYTSTCREPPWAVPGPPPCVAAADPPRRACRPQ